MVLKIYGKVQGVFFREFSRLKAKELDLTGFVMNEPDGTVRLVAEGEESNLREMLEWCGKGPDHAEVDKVEIKWSDLTDKFCDFLVK